MQNKLIKFAQNTIVSVLTIAFVTLVIDSTLCFLSSLVTQYSFVECFVCLGNEIVLFFTAFSVIIAALWYLDNK
jgi:hypothetical protein